jgi:hypothetical protein
LYQEDAAQENRLSNEQTIKTIHDSGDAYRYQVAASHIVEPFPRHPLPLLQHKMRARMAAMGVVDRPQYWVAMM